MMAYSKKFNYIVKWHAKSGCCLFRQLFVELHKNEITKSLEPDKHDNPGHFHICSKIFPYNKEKVFLKINLVRNPYHRAVSMFTNKMCGEYGILNNSIKLEKHTFFHFVKYLYEHKNNLLEMDLHVHIQSNGYEKDDIIIKLENFENEIIKAYDKPNYDVLIPKIKEFLLKNKNETQKINRSIKKVESDGFVGLIEYTPDSCAPWSQYKDFYNEEIKYMVYETYKSDFDTFNYDKNII
jgi:hypothetical protein